MLSLFVKASWSVQVALKECGERVTSQDDFNRAHYHTVSELYVKMDSDQARRIVRRVD